MTDKAPTVQEEMAKFAGFTTNNGETVAPGKEHKAGSAVDLSEEEIAAGAKLASGAATKTPAEKVLAAKEAAKAPAAVKLTDEEQTAALTAARTSLKLGDDEELTKEEEDEALLAALTEKKTATAPKADRLKRAQEGRRREAARAARAETANAELLRRVAALEAGGKAPLTDDKKGGKEADATKEPDPKDFEFGEVDAKYIRALARWETKQELALAATKNQKTQQTEEQSAAAAEFAEKIAAFEEAGIEAIDDFQEVVIDTMKLPKSDPAAWPLSAQLGQLILESDFGAHIAYALASDVKEAKRIEKLPVAQQIKWFVQQETKFEAEKPAGEKEEVDETEGAARSVGQAAPARQVSKAPPPPRRNNGGSGNRGVTSATTDFAAFEALAQAKPARR